MGGEPEGAAAGAEASANSGNAVVHVRCSNGNKFTVEVDLGATVLALKGLLVERSEIPADQQRLIYKGRVLKDDHLLNSYGGCEVIRLIVRLLARLGISCFIGEGLDWIGLDWIVGLNWMGCADLGLVNLRFPVDCGGEIHGVSGLGHFMRVWSIARARAPFGWMVGRL